VCGAWWPLWWPWGQLPGVRNEGLIYTLYGVAMVGIGMLSHTGNNVAMDALGRFPITPTASARWLTWDPKAWKHPGRAGRGGQTLLRRSPSRSPSPRRLSAATSLFFSFVADALTLPFGGLEGMGITEFLKLLDQGIPVSTLTGNDRLPIGRRFCPSSSRPLSACGGPWRQPGGDRVRKQFKVPGVLEGTKTPDYGKVVGITTAAAQKELISLVVLSVSLPLLVAFLFDVKALGTFLPA